MDKPTLLKMEKRSPFQSSRQTKTSGVDRSILESKIGYQIRVADRILSRDFLRDVGLTQVQYSVYSLVATNDNLSQVEVGEALGMDRASTMAVVDKLEAAGLIERTVSAVDKRMHSLKLTEAGKKGFAATNRKVIEHENRYQHRLTASEQAAFFKCLWKIRNG